MGLFSKFKKNDSNKVEEASSKIYQMIDMYGVIHSFNEKQYYAYMKKLIGIDVSNNPKFTDEIKRAEFASSILKILPEPLRKAVNDDYVEKGCGRSIAFDELQVATLVSSASDEYDSSLYRFFTFIEVLVSFDIKTAVSVTQNVISLYEMQFGKMKVSDKNNIMKTLADNLCKYYPDDKNAQMYYCNFMIHIFDEESKKVLYPDNFSYTWKSVFSKMLKFGFYEEALKIAQFAVDSNLPDTTKSGWQGRLDKVLDKMNPELTEKTKKVATRKEKKENVVSQKDIDFYMEALNLIMPGLQIFVRDVNLSPEYISKYKVGNIIRVRHFTDASDRVQGMITNTRYQILSNHMADLRQFEHGTNWGLHVGQVNSRFKVIDVFEKNGKTLISLLHLPEDIHWRAFINSAIEIEGVNLEQMARERFLDKFENDPIPELANDGWLSRCEIPLGINPDGTMVPVELLPGEGTKVIEKTSFREIINNVMFLKSSKLLKQFGSIDDLKDSISKAEGIICFGYVDKEAGLTLEVFDFARIANDKVEVVPMPNISLKIRIGNVKEAEFFTLLDTPFDISNYLERINFINDNYKVEPGTPATREITILDEFRNFEYPDDVAVILTSEKFNPEQVWVRCVDQTEKYIIGRLLNEPNNDMGVHINELLAFVPVENDKNHYLLRVDPKKLK